MIRILCIASLALAVVSAVSGHVLRHRGPPKGWAAAYLEPYDVYHARYLDFGCKEKHNTTYFSDCCHPLLKDESISVLHDRKCFSTANSASDNVNCDDGNSPVSPASHPAASPPPVMSPSPEQSTPTSSPPVHTTAPPPQTPARPAAVEHAPVSPAEHSSAPVTTNAATSTPAPANNGNNGGNWQWGGLGTYYLQNGHAGACRQYHADTELIAAIDQAWYGDLTLVSSLCWKQVEIINTDNQKTVTVTIVDACPTCDNGNSIDLSVQAFDTLSDQSVGKIPIKWRFV